MRRKRLGKQPFLTTTALSGPLTGSLTRPVARQVVGAKPDPLQILGVPVLTNKIGLPYTGFTVSASGGRPPYKFSIASGVLPLGLQINVDTGLVSGTPSVLGLLGGIVIRVTDAGGRTADLAPFGITITL